MGRKHKLKLRKHSRENVVRVSDTSDDGVVGVSSTGKVKCPHSKKAVNINTLRKVLKHTDFCVECTACSRDGNKKDGGSSCRSDSGLGTAETDMEDILGGEVMEPCLWLCMQCGHQGCGRNSHDQHALRHYEIPRSTSHAVVLNLSSWVIWCYDCDTELSKEDNGRLSECVTFVYKQLGTHSEATSAAGNKRVISTNGDAPQENVLTGDNAKQKNTKSTQSATVGSFPKVKGLSNLGNTCFFNAVLQNLSQTPLLEAVLSEHGKKGASVSLSHHQVDSSSSEADEPSTIDAGRRADRRSARVTPMDIVLPECGVLSQVNSSSSETDEPSTVDPVRRTDRRTTRVTPMDIVMPECGVLSQSLLSFLHDMSPSGSRNTTLSPGGLFSQVCKKAPRFKGFQQQDSHELLRHLMDGMKAEEIKRSQTAILKAFHLQEPINSKKVDDETKAKIKEYGQLVKHTFVDKLFGGCFISTVLCEECHTPSQILEPFLDISLPVMEEKAQRPNSMWLNKKETRVKAESPDSTTHKSDLADSGRLSKYALKREKKRLKKDAKRKNCAAKQQSVLTSNAGQQTSAPSDEVKASTTNGQAAPVDRDAGTGSRSNTEDEEEGNNSDADIEDNLDTDSGKKTVAPMTCDSDDKIGDIPISTRLCGDTDNDTSPVGGDALTLDVHTPDCCNGVLHGGAVSCRQESDSGGIIACGVHIEDGHLAEVTDRMHAIDIAGNDDVTKTDTCCVSLEGGYAGRRNDVKVTSVAENSHNCDVAGDAGQKLYRTEVSLYVSQVNGDGQSKIVVPDEMQVKNKGTSESDLSRVKCDGQSNSEVLRDDSRVKNGHRESEVMECVSHVKDDVQGNTEVKDSSDEIKTNGQSDLDVQDLTQVKDDGQNKTKVQDVTRVIANGHCSIEAHDCKETNCSVRNSLVNGVETESSINVRKQGKETEQCVNLPLSQCNGRLSPCGSCDKSRNDVGTPSNAADGEKQTNSIHNTKYQKKLEVRLKAMTPLSPPKHGRQSPTLECSMDSCLSQFTSTELLTGNNKFGCDTCTRHKHSKQQDNKKDKKDVMYTNASKQILIFSPPAVLTLHLKRFQQIGYSLRKVNRHVNFPMIVDLAPYCSALCQGIRPGQSEVLYSLYGVVEHSGRLSGGHYTAYVKVRHHMNRLKDFLQNSDVSRLRLDKLWAALQNSSQDTAELVGQPEVATPTAGKWYYISDSRVTEVVSEASVLRCQAYMLFYERIY